MARMENKLPTVVKREIIENVNGWDENLSFFGEDRDFNERIRREYKIGFCKSAKVYITPVKDITALFKQSSSYGRSMSQFLGKKFKPVFFIGILIHATFFPLLILTLSNKIFLYLFLLLLTLFSAESIYYFRKSFHPYSVFIPLLKVFRSTIEIIYFFI
jgi:GT2 family glycosyltransferase